MMNNAGAGLLTLLCAGAPSRRDACRDPARQRITDKPIRAGKSNRKKILFIQKWSRKERVGL